MDHFAGLDVSVKETSVCIVDNTGRIVREVKVPSEPEALLVVLKNPACPKFAVMHTVRAIVLSSFSAPHSTGRSLPGFVRGSCVVTIVDDDLAEIDRVFTTSKLSIGDRLSAHE